MKTEWVEGVLHYSCDNCEEMTPVSRMPLFDIRKTGSRVPCVKSSCLDKLVQRQADIKRALEPQRIAA